MWMRYAAFAALVLLVAALTAAILLTSDAGPQFTPAAVTDSPVVASPVVASPPPADPQATPTPPADPQATPTLPADPRITHTLTVTVTGGGSVTPGTSTQNEGDEVTLTASWNDATHSFTSWGGDCSGTDTECTLMIDAPKTVTATFAALAAGRCATTTAADCIRAVYLGAPGAYAQVADIPADALLTPDADGHYLVERGQQVTVVTAAPLPAGWTRFYLQQTLLGTPSPVSTSQLNQAVGTTYTFTVTEDEAASTLITFDLTAARPFVRPRPDGKPDLGDVVVTTVFRLETTALRYNTLDTAGAVAEPGSYAFLADPADPADPTSAITTYEALRDGTTTALLIHKSDAHGASQAALYDAVEAGDLFEWHEAEDCFVRYKVTEVKPDLAGAVPRKLLAIEWMTYAFTGCSGAVSVNAAATVDWGALPDLGGASLRVPIVHGTAQLVPPDWTGPMKRAEFRDHFITESAEAYTTDPAEARELDYWREPELPPGWRLARAFSGGVEGPPLGYCAHYLNAAGRTGVYICGYQDGLRYEPREAHIWTGLVFEARIVAGRPAVVQYNPNPEGWSSITVWVYDAATEGVYRVDGRAPSLIGGNVEAVIAIARSLFEPPNPLPPPTTFRYDRYDTTGEVAEPGSYAFLADPADTTSAVTTYEALRDGTATALLLHKSDMHGASQGALYDTVEAGHLIEWREADDCFVRYRVTDAPEPAATAAQRKFGVRWETYVFQGCQTGSLPAGASAVQFTAASELPLEHLGGTNLTDFAVVHGPWQLVPEGWTGATKEPTSHRPPANSGERETTDIAVVRTFPYWREPTLPAGWGLNFASTGAFDGPAYGYGASFGPRGGVTIGGYYATGRRYERELSHSGGRRVLELLVIAGRPAMISYSPPGPDHVPNASEELWIYDAATESEYVIFADHSPFGKDDVIAIARSLFASPSPR